MPMNAVASGATKTFRILTAVNQEVTIWCAGQSKVGIGITSVTGTPTLSFFGSTDGVQFNPITVAAYPSALSSSQGNLPASGVVSVTAAGNYEVNVGNLQYIRVQMTTGNGPATVVLTASIDGSYQEAFFTQATLYPSSSSSSGINSVNIPAQGNRAIALSYCSISVQGGGVNAGANIMARIWDGPIGTGNVLYTEAIVAPSGSVSTVQQLKLPTDQQGNIDCVGTPGNQMNIQVVGAGNNLTIINAKVSLM